MPSDTAMHKQKEISLWRIEELTLSAAARTQ